MGNAHRIWNLMDQLSIEVQSGRMDASVDDTQKRVLFAYVQLCEDEADLYIQGRVTQGTWQIWKTGIDEMLSVPGVRGMLEQAPPSRFDTLRRYVHDGDLRPMYRGFWCIVRGL